MAFEATKKEWCELYSFFRLLTDGKVVLGRANIVCTKISITDPIIINVAPLPIRS